MQVIAVSAVVVISTVCPGRIGVLEVVADAPGAQNAVLVAPVLLARTDLPAVNADELTPPVVAVIGVRELSVWKPEKLKLPLMGKGAVELTGVQPPNGFCVVGGLVIHGATCWAGVCP